MKQDFLVCPLCDHERFVPQKEADITAHPLYRKELPPKIEWVWCSACGHVFTSSYWSDKAMALICETALADQVARVQDAELHRRISSRVVERVSLFKPSGRWLDVGFGNGSLLFTAAEYGFEASGIDMKSMAVMAAAELGYSVSTNDIGEEPSRHYDVVSLADVIEHVPYPKNMLDQARRIMKLSGVLYVACPNMDTAVWKMMGDSNPYWSEIEHFHNFSRSRLTDLLTECGFTVLRYGMSERYLSGMEIICRIAAGHG